MTQPMVGVILNRCVTVDASRSLSYRVLESVCHPWDTMNTNGNFALGYHDRCVFSPYSNGSVS